MLTATAELEADPGPDTVEAMAHALSAFSMSGLDAAEELTERALVLAQQLGVSGPHWIDLLIHRGLVLGTRDRKGEAAAYFREALRLAVAADSPVAQARALLNLGDAVSSTDPAEGLRLALKVTELARLTGARLYLLFGTANGVVCAVLTGEWDVAEALVTRALEDDGVTDVGVLTPTAALVSALRGDTARARAMLEPLSGEERATPRRRRTSTVSGRWSSRRRVMPPVASSTHSGQPRRAPGWVCTPTWSSSSWPLAARAATATHDDAATKALVGMLDGRHQGELSPLLRAELALTRARALPEAEARASALGDAVAASRAAGSPYHLALALLDLADAQRSVGQDAPELIAEAMSIGRVLRSPLVVRRARGDSEPAGSAAEREVAVVRGDRLVARGPGAAVERQLVADHGGEQREGGEARRGDEDEQGDGDVGVDDGHDLFPSTFVDSTDVEGTPVLVHSPARPQ